MTKEELEQTLEREYEYAKELRSLCIELYEELQAKDWFAAQAFDDRFKELC